MTDAATARGPRSAPGPERPGYRPPLWLVFTITISGITTNTLITAGLPDLVDGIGASRAAAGLVMAAGSLPGIVMATAIGLLADRYGRREVIVPCMVLFGVAGGLVGLVDSLGAVLALRALQGVGSAGLINLGAVIIGDHWEGEARARILGINAGVLTLCLAVFPVIGGWLTDLGGWRAPFRIYPLAVIPALVVWRNLPARRRSPSDGAPTTLRAQLRDAWPELTSARHLSSLGAVMGVFVLIFGMMLTLLPLHADEVFGLGPSARGLVLGAPALGSSLAAFTVSRFSGRHGRPRVVAASALFFASALLIMATATALPVLVAATLLFGLAEGSSFPTLQDAIAGNASPQHRGTLMASQVSAARLGQTIGPVTATGLAGLTDRRTTFALGALVAMGVILPLGRRGVRGDGAPSGAA